MEELKTPVCPRCGKPMKLKTVHVWTNIWVAWFTHCGWHTPTSQRPTRERAVEAATKGANRHPMQKPLTLENVLSLKSPVWVEYRVQEDDVPIGWAVFPDNNAYRLEGVGIYAVYFGMAEPFLMIQISYGTVWRCWNNEPTEEEREAAPWNG